MYCKRWHLYAVRYVEYSLLFHLLDTLPALVGITDTTTSCPDCEITLMAISGMASVGAVRLTSPAVSQQYGIVVRDVCVRQLHWLYTASSYRSYIKSNWYQEYTIYSIARGHKVSPPFPLLYLEFNPDPDPDSEPGPSATPLAELFPLGMSENGSLMSKLERAVERSSSWGSRTMCAPADPWISFTLKMQGNGHRWWVLSMKYCMVTRDDVKQCLEESYEGAYQFIMLKDTVPCRIMWYYWTRGSAEMKYVY